MLEEVRGDGLFHIDRSTLKDSVQAMLRELLLKGTFSPGDILSANALAKQLRLSNSPVREAMLALVERGLLEVERGRGFRLVELSEHDIQEVYEMRRLVEVEAVRKAAQMHLDDSQKDALWGLARRTDELGNVSSDEQLFQYLEADQRFHMYIASLSGNSRLEAAVDKFRDQSRVNGYYLHLSRCALRGTADEHLRIADAIVSRDVQRAVELMIDHLEYARNVAGRTEVPPSWYSGTKPVVDERS